MNAHLEKNISKRGKKRENRHYIQMDMTSWTRTNEGHYEYQYRATHFSFKKSVIIDEKAKIKKKQKTGKKKEKEIKGKQWV